MAHGPRRAGSCTPCTCRRSLGQTRWGQRSCWRWPYRSCRSWLLPLHRYIVDVQQRYFCADFCHSWYIVAQLLSVMTMQGCQISQRSLSPIWNYQRDSISKYFQGQMSARNYKTHFLSKTFSFQDPCTAERRSMLIWPILIWPILIWPILIWPIIGQI